MVAPEGVVRGHRARAREVAARARSGLSVEKATSVVLETVLGAKGRGRVSEDPCAVSSVSAGPVPIYATSLAPDRLQEGVSGAQVESLMRAVDVLEANGGKGASRGSVLGCVAA